MYTIFCTWLTTRKGYESVQASVCAWHVHTDFDVRRTSKTFSGKAQYVSIECPPRAEGKTLSGVPIFYGTPPTF
jgi:hypothetical protein